jgi:hypothetical protein
MQIKQTSVISHPLLLLACFKKQQVTQRSPSLHFVDQRPKGTSLYFYKAEQSSSNFHPVFDKLRLTV